MDVERTERIESDLDLLIQRRAQANGADEEREELWRASVAAYHRKHQTALREEWITYHERCAANLERTARGLAAEHRQKAAKLREQEPKEGA